MPKVRPGGILCGHDFWKTMDYTKAILSNVPAGKTLDLGYLVPILRLHHVLRCFLCLAHAICPPEDGIRMNKMGMEWHRCYQRKFG